jgi:hypothetical protein
MRHGAIALMVLGASGCAVVGPSCMERQQSGHVATINGSVAAGGVARHEVMYASDGSQNDVNLTWSGQRSASPPRLAFYATRATCEAFDPAAPQGGCAILGRGGWADGHIATTLIVTNGRGNPDVLGVPPVYRIWVVGDPDVASAYTMDITWFFGPDC